MLRIAIQGCGHGALDLIYKKIANMEAENCYTVDLLLVCGDFQAIRDKTDLNCMSVPEKYKSMGDFVHYFNGSKKAPVLTIFIGGNHEATNFLASLYYGGWVAPNMFYLGHSGVVRFGGCRIAGYSGIYKNFDADLGYFERMPFSPAEKRSAYHTRRFEALKLSHLAASPERVDVFIAHEWPRGVYEYGDKLDLLRKKPFFREDIEAEVLGCPFGASLLKMLRPAHWFSAHLHVAFEAAIPHDDGSQTSFVALDKCKNRSEHLRVLEVPLQDTQKLLEFDLEWLAVLSSYTEKIPRGAFPQDPQPSLQVEISAASQKIKTFFKDKSLQIPPSQAQYEDIFAQLGVPPANIITCSSK